MKGFRVTRNAFFACALGLTSALAATNPIDEIATAEGLQKLNVKDIDLAYGRPGATLSSYTKIMLEPVDVAFHKDWNPDRTGSRFKLSATERENIRSGVSRVVYDEFVRTLTSKSPYEMAKEAGPDVLRVKAKVLNLYVNAPDVPTAGRSRTYTVSAGEMTLLLELFDSESGAILARVVDRREARNTGVMNLSSSVVNAGEARAIAAVWARALKNALDKAHGIGKK